MNGKVLKVSHGGLHESLKARKNLWISGRAGLALSHALLGQNRRFGSLLCMYLEEFEPTTLLQGLSRRLCFLKRLSGRQKHLIHVIEIGYNYKGT